MRYGARSIRSKSQPRTDRRPRERTAWTGQAETRQGPSVSMTLHGYNESLRGDLRDPGATARRPVQLRPPGAALSRRCPCEAHAPDPARSGSLESRHVRRGSCDEAILGGVLRRVGASAPSRPGPADRAARRSWTPLCPRHAAGCEGQTTMPPRSSWLRYRCSRGHRIRVSEGARESGPSPSNVLTRAGRALQRLTATPEHSLVHMAIQTATSAS